MNVRGATLYCRGQQHGSLHGVMVARHRHLRTSPRLANLLLTAAYCLSKQSLCLPYSVGHTRSPFSLLFCQDSRDWEALTGNEQHFISMVLAFFAASDGIVMENLVSCAKAREHAGGLCLQSPCSDWRTVPVRPAGLATVQLRRGGEGRGRPGFPVFAFSVLCRDRQIDRQMAFFFCLPIDRLTVNECQKQHKISMYKTRLREERRQLTHQIPSVEQFALACMHVSCIHSHASVRSSVHRDS